MLCRLKGCDRCTGDLVMDEAEWKCIQCGRYYAVNRLAIDSHRANLGLAATADPLSGSDMLQIPERILAA